MNKFNIGDKVWFKLDSYGRKAEMHGTICNYIDDGINRWYYDIKTSDNKHWNIPEKDINYSAPHTRDHNYNRKNEEKELKEDEETIKDFMNKIYGKSDFIQPFLLGDLVMYKDASKPDIFTVIDRLEFKDPAGNTAYSYRIKRTTNDGKIGDIVHIVDHDKLVKVDKYYRGGGYIYPVGARVRFKFDKRELIGYIKERYQDGRYEIRVERTYVIKPDSILGYAANWIDDPSIRKAFGLDVNKNDIYEDIKKQINKDQLNFHYGLRSIFPLAPNDTAVPFELSEKEKEYVRNDAAATMSYIHELHKNGFYGTGTDTKIIIDDILKEDNKMKKEQKKRIHDFVIVKEQNFGRRIKEVIFNGPATIIKWQPTIEQIGYGKQGDKTVVVCQDGDKQDMKVGFLLAIIKEMVDNQSYDNILRKIDSFEKLDIPQVGKDDVFKFKVGDIVRFEHGVARFKVDKRTTFTTSSGKVVPRYRIIRILGSKDSYSTYANENALRFAYEVYNK